ncbi:MAG: hypothetical protein HYV06_09725 [Deltaproteobacteria bacterium]|nr:hypothetical protein [Deltaproteobacteria bacterium]
MPWPACRYNERREPRRKEHGTQGPRSSIWPPSAGGNQLGCPVAYRLAFRELGLSIGLKGVVPLREWSERNPKPIAAEGPLQRKIEALAGYLPLAGEIEGFWLEGRNRVVGTWREHREINMVMLATSLAPDGFLSI